jgi:hypothetical protein
MCWPLSQHDVRVALRDLAHDALEPLHSLVNRLHGLARQRTDIHKHVVFLTMGAGINADQNTLDAGCHPPDLEFPGYILAQIMSREWLAALGALPEHDGTSPGLGENEFLVAPCEFPQTACPACFILVTCRRKRKLPFRNR